ncbi:fluoride efflux transporter FluC [Rhodococcoides kyotonense]|uniref:Fluoride-specific ion channel FluC n=1 Tax=Rhodococcoides kyotonense TaxID=398843 RepID=A0A239M557_9NOCA|nr:CrcB family protein [Rhodococcus kyotonensis]SNT37124.1 CrcB protein [Rhodococcus kyotonensis]
MTAALVVAVAGIGAIGAGARYATDETLKKIVSPSFPWATLCINIIASFGLGVVTGMVLVDGAPSELRVLVGVGFCSSYSIFSTAMLEAVILLRQGRWRSAVAAAAGTFAATSLTAAVGLAVGSA